MDAEELSRRYYDVFNAEPPIDTWLSQYDEIVVVQVVEGMILKPTRNGERISFPNRYAEAALKNFDPERANFTKRAPRKTGFVHGEIWTEFKKIAHETPDAIGEFTVLGNPHTQDLPWFRLCADLMQQNNIDEHIRWTFLNAVYQSIGIKPSEPIVAKGFPFPYRRRTFEYYHPKMYQEFRTRYQHIRAVTDELTDAKARNLVVIQTVIGESQ